MTTIILIIFCLSVSLGLFFIFADVLKVPYIKSEKAIMNAGKQRKSVSVEAIMLNIAMRVSFIVKIDNYKKHRLENILKSADIKMTPEVYIAHAYAKAGAVLLGVIPCLFIFPLFSIAIVMMTIAVYFKEIQRADKKLKAIREKIEIELPRFVATLEQELKNSRDILSIMESYKKHAGDEFAHEIDITCADMRSSSYEGALTRFESRVNSPQLSDVVRGMISVLRGDDGAVYFAMLAHDLKLVELQRLKAQAQKIPPKIRIFSFLMLACLILTYMIIIALEIVNSLGTMF